MKFIYSCVLFFASCQASSAFNTNKIIGDRVEKNIGLYAQSGINSVEDNIKNTRKQVDKQLRSLLQEGAGEALNKIQNVTGQAVPNKQAFFKEVQDGVSNLVDDFLRSYDSAAEGAKALKENVLEQEGEIFDLVYGKVQNLITEFTNETKNTSGSGKNLVAIKRSVVDDLVNGGNQLIEDVNKRLADMLKDIRGVAEKINEAQAQRASEFVTAANDFIKSVTERFTQGTGAKEVMDNISVIQKEVGSRSKEVIDRLFSDVKRTIGVVENRVNNIVNNVFNLQDTSISK